MDSSDPWVAKVESMIRTFASSHSMAYAKSEREISASFEIGCFHALIDFYSANFSVEPCNLTDSNEYRYLTTPSGNPANFSFVRLKHTEGEYELRQQVRVRSHLHDDISFTPDLLVVNSGANIYAERDTDYAGGKRSFYTVKSSDVIAAHECKSMNPFPELLVSFIGMLIAAHDWLESSTDRTALSAEGLHLAPSLFVGGTARALHIRMVKALEAVYPINIILGLHSGNWSLHGSTRRFNLLQVTLARPSLIEAAV
jgi:hypothetical protein